MRNAKYVLYLLLAMHMVTWMDATPSADATILAVGGRALMPIVIAPGASGDVRQTAEELAGYLRRMTGAAFAIREGDGTGGIVLGTLRDFPSPSLAAALAIRNGVDGREAYAIRTEPSRVLLLGGADPGVSHAAFRFLEHAGCRWFFPSREWEIVPRLRTLAVQFNESDRPAVLSRRIWYGYGYFPDEKNRPLNDYQAWVRHNRMGGSRTISCGHAWQSIIADNKALFAAHPEYLALTGGKRQGEQLCVSNPAVRALAVQWAIAQLRKDPKADMVSMECSDGGGQCNCANCARLGSISNRVFGLANEVARAVRKTCPGKMVGLYAYNEHCEPPSFPLEPNVYVQSTAGFITGRYTFDELLQLWPKVCRQMGFYLYFSVYAWDWDKLPGGAGGNLKYLREEIPRLAASGATSFDCESGDNWGPHGRGYYIASRLMWNPQADVDALLQDFYRRAFGPAAGIMQRYYERLDPGNKPLVSENLLAQALRDLDAAACRAAGYPDVQARLDDMKQYLHFNRLCWDSDHTTDEAARKQLTLAALTHVYRTRYSYMNHWEAMRQSWTSKAAVDFKEPTWSFAEATTPKPWAVETPYTHRETETRFQEDLRHFRLQRVQEVRFSRDLVPSGLHDPAPAASSQSYQGSGKYALYSVNGEPLDFSLTVGLIAWYRNRAKAGYTLTDAAGKVIAQARLPLDGKAKPQSVRVPAPGLYWLVVDDQATGWNISAPAGKPLSLVLTPDYHPQHMGWMQRIYFYVPKGTKSIQYYWNGGPHKIFTPDGKERVQVKDSGKYLNCDVRRGEDGKAWSFTELAIGELYFTNCPGYLAASPDALLLPREVVAKDGRTRQ